MRTLILLRAFFTASFISEPSFANARFETNSITPNFLVVYFHSHGGNYNEPFTKLGAEDGIAKALLKDIPGVAVQSIDRSSTFALNGSDGYLAISRLITQRLKEHQSFKHIILCGTSLGAYEAFAYLHYAPLKIFEKIGGIIAVAPTDDLTELYWNTESQQLKKLLFDAFGGDPAKSPSKYKERSIKALYGDVPDRPDMKVCIVSEKRDRVVPPGQQKRLCATLRQKNFKVTMVEIDRGHSAADSITYGNALHFVTDR